MTSHAQTAQAIRNELKAAFPSIKFTVRSESFSGGDSVRISYTNGVPYELVQNIVGKYQYGNFDGMTDCYNNDNTDASIPQVKYVQVSRDISKEIKEEVKNKIAAEYGITDVNDENQWMKTFHYWSDQVMWRELSTMTF